MRLDTKMEFSWVFYLAVIFLVLKVRHWWYFFAHSLIFISPSLFLLVSLWISARFLLLIHYSIKRWYFLFNFLCFIFISNFLNFFFQICFAFLLGITSHCILKQTSLYLFKKSGTETKLLGLKYSRWAPLFTSIHRYFLAGVRLPSGYSEMSRGFWIVTVPERNTSI
jgi:hypothetical protein